MPPTREHIRDPRVQFRTGDAQALPKPSATYDVTVSGLAFNFVAESMRQRLGSTWCVAASGLAAPTPGRFGATLGRMTLTVASPLSRIEVVKTGRAGREVNMIEVTTAARQFFRDTLRQAGD